MERTGRHPERGHNVVIHEFAHALDLFDGSGDGTPPLRGLAEVRRWVEVCSREYRTLRGQARHDGPRLLDRYGATNEVEFFAVVTEMFFDRPLALRRQHEELYAVLKAFYRQDPAARLERLRSRSDGGDC